MMGILPDRFRDDQGGVGVDVAEDLQALLLRSDEAVLFVGFVGMGPYDAVSFRVNGACQGPFHCLLGGPAGLVGGEPEIAIGNELHLAWPSFRAWGGVGRFHDRKGTSLAVRKVCEGDVVASGAGNIGAPAPWQRRMNG
jgi:hypothetical protein